MSNGRARAQPTSAGRPSRRIIERAKSGAIQRDADYQDALFALVAAGNRASVELLAGALDGVGAEMRSALRAFYLEADALGPPIEGLAIAVDELLLTPPNRRVQTNATLRAATDRLLARAASAHGADSTSALRVLAAGAEARRVGPAHLQLARLASEALGRIGIQDGAADSLERYLAVEQDELRAVPVALALCRLARPSSEHVLTLARDRLGTVNGIFWSQVAPDTKHFGAEDETDLTSAEAFLERARRRGRKGDVDGAIRDATRAMKLQPSSAKGYILRGFARHHDRDPEGAVADYSQAIAVEPTNPVGWSDRGFMKIELGDLDGAIADLDRSLALRPASARTLTYRATALRMKGNMKAAMAGYEEALKINPRAPDAYRERAEAYLEQGDPAAAVADDDRALAIDAGDYEALAARAVARLSAKDDGGALADATRAVELNPRSGRALIARAKVRRTRGDVEGALADARGALALDLLPRDAAAARALVGALTRAE